MIAMRAQIRNAIYNTSIYDWSLRGSTPERLRGIPPEPLAEKKSIALTGSSFAGGEILNGNYLMFGQKHHLGDLPWKNTRLPDQKTCILHRFGFLADLKVLGTADAADKGRELMTRWINENGRWRARAWDPEITGGRLTNWLRTYDFLRHAEHPGFELTFLESCATQIRHLSRTIIDAPGDEQAIEAAEGLILGAICLKDMETHLESGLEALEVALDHQILGDGGHFQRNPTVQFNVLVRLVRVRGTMRAAQLSVPAWLTNSIDMMAPMLQTYRHGDGKLALFNGATEGSRDAIDQLLKAADAKSKSPLNNAPHTGYQRGLSTQGSKPGTESSVLITDSGAAVVSGANRDAHAGLLSFEFSHGVHRIIVNCGANNDHSDSWHMPLRATAAHSTLCVDDTNALEVLEDGGLKHFDTHVTSRRSEQNGSTFFQMRHDGYRNIFGLIHSRDIYLSAAGDDLRGRDKLKLMMDHTGKQAKKYAVRFHLHPSISAELSGNRKSAILKVSNKEGWRFRCSGGTLSIEDSVYLGTPGRKRRSAQLVLTGLINAHSNANGHSEPGSQDMEIKWSMIKEG